MKKLLTLVVALFILALAVPAMATVVVTGDIDKDKDITVVENVFIDKDINITVTVDDILAKVAEADAVVNQDNTNNYACQNCAEKIALIQRSIGVVDGSNMGIVNVNQATGNENNQGNVVSVAIDVWPPDQPPPDDQEPPVSDGGLAHAQTSAEQVMGGTLETGNTVDSIAILWRNSQIINSIIDNLGIVGVNQTAGNINNQLNVATVAACLDGVMAIAEADLGQLNAYNTVNEPDPKLDRFCNGPECGTNKNVLISGSVNGNIGVVGVNQTSGNMANQANIANMAYSIR